MAFGAAETGYYSMAEKAAKQVGFTNNGVHSVLMVGEDKWEN